MNVALICLHRRGGPVYETRDFAILLEESGIGTSIVTLNSSDLYFEVIKGDDFSTPFLLVEGDSRPLKSFLKIWSKRRNNTKRLNSFLEKFQIDLVIVVMPHPTDSFVYKACRMVNVPIWTIIHDSRLHSGDLWPTKFAQRRRISKSKHVLFHSKGVATAYGIDCDQFDIISFPKNSKLKHFQELIGSTHNLGASNKSSDETRVLAELLPGDFALVIGRIKAYKGILALIDQWQSLTIDANLVVAGKGGERFRRHRAKGVFILDKWLTENEFLDLLLKSRLVILPYSEASQSGVAELAMQANKRILAHNIPALVEQLNHYEKVYFYNNHSEPNFNSVFLNAWMDEFESSPLPSKDSIGERVNLTLAGTISVKFGTR